MSSLKLSLLALLAGILQSASAAAPKWEDVPPDLPLPASAPCTAPWLAQANMLQPVGHSQFTLLTQLGERPARRHQEFGFNAITIQPPDSHNCDTDLSPNDKLTEEQFRAGVAAYRAAGYRILLYTSLTGCGQAPEFQSGQIAREHPDWSQRDPAGNPYYGLWPAVALSQYRRA